MTEIEELREISNEIKKLHHRNTGNMHHLEGLIEHLRKMLPKFGFVEAIKSGSHATIGHSECFFCKRDNDFIVCMPENDEWYKNKKL